MQSEQPFDAETYFAAAHALVCAVVLALSAFVGWFMVWAAIARRREHRLLTRCIDAELRVLSKRDNELAKVAQRLSAQKAQPGAPWRCIEGGKSDRSRGA